MSLVDDLLIEAERRRGSARAAKGVRLDDLVPIRKGATSQASRRGARGARRLLIGAAVIAGTLAIVSILPAIPFGAWRTAATTIGSQKSRAEMPAPAPPPVAARPAEGRPPEARSPESGSTEAASLEAASTAAPSSDAAPSPVASRASRPIRVESLTLEPLAIGARLRIVADAETPHRIEHASGAARFDLVLSGASLAAAHVPLDLRETPIRSLDLRTEGPDLRLALELDPQVRLQSRWLALPEGAALIVELQAPAAAAIDVFASLEDPGPMPLGSAALPFSIDPAFERSERDRRREPADRIVSPPLGDPAELRIERSARDRAREERRVMRERVDERLAEARRARAAGSVDEADRLYAEILTLSPGDARALVEWSELLAESGHTQRALALLEAARERAPRNASLLLAQARVLGRDGELRRAIEILDTSGFALTESPDVHALAAAYHQRAGDHAAAIERYERLLQRFPEESRSWMGLGISLEAVGRRDEARDVYRIALQVGELPPASRSWLTTRLSALGQEG